jgi:excisionase family DNA binding protein
VPENNSLSKEQMLQKEKLTMGEAAVYLGVSIYKIRNLIETGMLRAEENILDRRKKLILRRQLDDLLQR